MRKQTNPKSSLDSRRSRLRPEDSQKQRALEGTQNKKSNRTITAEQKTPNPHTAHANFKTQQAFLTAS
jgi:hypothetical protein